MPTTIPSADDAANSPMSDGAKTITFLTTGRIVPKVPMSRASTISAPETRHTTIQLQLVFGMRSIRAATATGSVRPTANPPSKIRRAPRHARDNCTSANPDHRSQTETIRRVTISDNPRPDR
jgi:hypothetical protein